MVIHVQVVTIACTVQIGTVASKWTFSASYMPCFFVSCIVFMIFWHKVYLVAGSI